MFYVFSGHTVYSLDPNRQDFLEIVTGAIPYAFICIMVACLMAYKDVDSWIIFVFLLMCAAVAAFIIKIAMVIRYRLREDAYYQDPDEEGDPQGYLIEHDDRFGDFDDGQGHDPILDQSPSGNEHTQKPTYH